MIAMALACQPRLLIADEPTTALDPTVGAQITALLDELRVELGMAILLITHDLGVIAGIADRVLVMYAGRVAEVGAAEAVFYDHMHPYTRALVEAIPRLDEPKEHRLRTIEGAPPDLAQPFGKACRFQPRCPRAEERCSEQEPELDANGAGEHAAACFFPIRESFALPMRLGTDLTVATGQAAAPGSSDATGGETVLEVTDS